MVHGINIEMGLRKGKFFVNMCVMSFAIFFDLKFSKILFLNIIPLQYLYIVPQNTFWDWTKLSKIIWQEEILLFRGKY